MNITPLKIAFAFLVGLLAFLTYEALTTDYFSWDLTIAEWIQSRDAGSIAEYNGRMGIVGAAGVFGLLVIIWLWFKGWRAEAAFVGIVGITDLINPLLREVIGRPRPDPDVNPNVVFHNEISDFSNIDPIVMIYREPTDFSFPSGTAMHVVMFCGILIYFSHRVLKPSVLRTIIQVLLFLWIPLMGVWLIYRGVHWPSDVFGGFVYGAVFLWLIVWGYQKYVTWRRSRPKKEIYREQLPFLVRPITWIIRILY